MCGYRVPHLSARFKGPAPRCHRLATYLAVVLACGFVFTGCATYTQDLERARRHYQALEFPQALGVLRALGEDFDGLSPSERVQYTYLRGMTDFRLSETVPQTGTLRSGLRSCARDWLDECLALEKRGDGKLTVDQSSRARIALAQLIDVDAKPRACVPATVQSR
ncbi:MAG: hypothetical protein HOW73_03995 [Polyangiaceae bacterium]|nr:hypothetical protein [Polyangiaceae bacterium]